MKKKKKLGYLSLEELSSVKTNLTADNEPSITINKGWYDGLVRVLDELNKQIELDDKCVETHGWLSHLNGYVHSLDEYFKG